MVQELSVMLHIVGDGPERQRLENMVHVEGTENSVQFHGFQPDIVRYLNTADVLIMPSRTEGMPMALIEAAATGLPIIASNVGGIPEIVTHSFNGLLVQPDDPHELKQAIETMVFGYGRFESNSRAEAKNIIDRHSADRWVTRAVAEYQNAMISKR